MALTVNVYDHTGKKVSSKTLSKDVFGVEVNPQLLALAVRVYLSNQRQGTKSTQTRSQVSFTGAKLWRQKGTGRARHGSRRAPIFVGGGSAHGPTGNEQYQKKLTKKMRRKALLGSLSQKCTQNQISLIKDFSKIGGKTNQMHKLMQQILKNPSEKTLLILDRPEEIVIRSVKNLSNITTTQASRLNVYEILNHKNLIINLKALDIIAGKPKKEPSADKKPTPKKSVSESESLK